jgi:hypothetical protein
MELRLVEEALLVPIKPQKVVMVATLFFLQSLQTVVALAGQVLAGKTKEIMEVLVVGRQVTPVLNFPVVTGLAVKVIPVVLD